MAPRAPMIGICCDRRATKDNVWHSVAEEYIAAARDCAGVMPMLIPALIPPLPATAVLAHFDGLLFTGSISNVAPHRYQGRAPRDPSLLDEARDATTLTLLRAGIEAGTPILCICRGFQELNVALGGTLHQHVQEVAGSRDHRAKDGADGDVSYAPAHEVVVEAGGVLAALGVPPRFAVNSLHEQGIDTLASKLRIEARAPDGVVEAISLSEPGGFLLAVQWHPEWRAQENPVSRAIFSGFGEAVRKFSLRRNSL